MKMAMTLRAKESGTLNYSKVIIIDVKHENLIDFTFRDLELSWRPGVSLPP